MKLTKMTWAYCLPMLAACQTNTPTDYPVDENLNLKIDASIFRNNPSRATVDTEGNASFTNNDKIGFFMPNENMSAYWELNNDTWTPEKTFHWSNKEDDFEFCAYYPYTKSESRTQIAMPDLRTQSGKLSDIGKLDFLTARCTTNFSTNSGTVSFTGQSAFRHAYSFIYIILKKDASMKETVLNSVTFEGNDLFTPHNYTFGNMEKENKATPFAKETVNTLTIEQEAQLTEEGYPVAILCNPMNLEENLKFSIRYKQNNIQYQASTSAMGKEFNAGTLYKFTIRLTQENLIIEGNDIADWEVQNKPEEILIKENTTH